MTTSTKTASELRQEQAYLASFLGRSKEDEYYRIMKRLDEIRAELAHVHDAKF